MDSVGYLERQQDGKCAYSRRCKRPLAADSDLCDRHLKRERKRKADSARAARQNNRDLGLCAFCPNKSDSYRCATCAVKHGQVPTSRVAGSVATALDPFRRDNDGWRRYRGKGRRGPRAAGVTDEADLRDALKLAEDGRKALAYARSPEVQAMPRVQRAGVKQEGAAKLALAAGLLADVVARNDPERARDLAMLRTEIAGDGEP